LGRRSAGESVRKIAGKYAEMTARALHIFTGSSPGAAEFGFLKGKINPEN
jgi:hypothetical protein